MPTIPSSAGTPATVTVTPAFTSVHKGCITDVSAVIQPGEGQTIVQYQWSLLSGSGVFPASTTSGPTVKFFPTGVGPAVVQLEVTQDGGFVTRASATIDVLQNSVSMSSALASGMVQRIFDNGIFDANHSWTFELRGFLGANAPQGTSASSTNTTGQLHIMKGEMPTQSLSSMSQRQADILITYDSTASISANGENDFVLSRTQQNPAIIVSNNRNARASGTATWFILQNQRRHNSGGVASNTVLATEGIIHSIIGTVGPIGSGADLEIASTAITQGLPYRVSNMRIGIPTNWTY